MKKKIFVTAPFVLSVLLIASCGGSSSTPGGTSPNDSSSSPTSTIAPSITTPITPSTPTPSTPFPSTPVVTTPVPSTPTPSIPSTTPVPTTPTPTTPPPFIAGDYGEILGTWNGDDVVSQLVVETKSAIFYTEGLTLDLFPTKVALEQYTIGEGEDEESFIARTVYYNVTNSAFSAIKFKVYLPQTYVSFLITEISISGGEYEEYASLYPSINEFSGAWSPYPDEESSMNITIDSSAYDYSMGGYEGQFQYWANNYSGISYSQPFYSYEEGTFTKWLDIYLGHDLSDLEFFETVQVLEDPTEGIVLSSEYETYYYPSSLPFSSELWFDGESDRTISVTVDDNGYLVSVDGGAEVSASFKYDDEIGSYLELDHGSYTSTIQKVLNGIVIDDTFLAIKDPSAYVGEYTLRGNTFKMTEEFDYGTYETYYALTFNETPIDTFSYAINEDRILGLSFVYSGDTYTVFTNDGSSIIVDDGLFSEIYPSVKVYTEEFMGSYYIYSLEGNSVSVSELILNEDHTATYNGESISYAGVEYHSGYCVTFSTIDSTTHYFYLFAPSVLCHTTEDISTAVDYETLPSQDLIHSYCDTWTDGKSDYFQFDGEKFTFVSGTAVAFIFEFDSEDGLFALVLFQDQSIKALFFSDTVVMYDLDMTNGELLNEITLIKSSSFDNIVGTYTYVTSYGPESVFVEEDGTFKISTLVGDKIEVVEYDYFIYYYGGQVCIAFQYTETSTVMVYFSEDGIIASMMGGNVEFYYENISGLYQSNSSDDSLYIADDLAVYVNGTYVGDIDNKSVTEDGVVSFSVESASLTITVAEHGIIATTLNGGDIECTRVDFEFAVYVSSGVVYTTTGDAEVSVQFARNLTEANKINNGFIIDGVEVIYDSYTVQVVDGEIVITIAYGFDKIILTIDGTTVTATYEEGSSPLPPPPPPPPPPLI